MGRARTVSRVMAAPTHGDVEKRCVVMTETAIHTISLSEGHFTAIVMSLPGPEGSATMAILDHDEVEAQITFLRNSVEDAKRLDAGASAIHAAPTLRRQ